MTDNKELQAASETVEEAMRLQSEAISQAKEQEIVSVIKPRTNKKTSVNK